MKARPSENRLSAKEAIQKEKKINLKDASPTALNGNDPLHQLLQVGRRRNRVRRMLLVLSALIILAGSGFAVFQWKKKTAAGKVPQYVSEPVTKGDLTSTISATGTVQALNTVEVGAEISGRILSLKADFNDTVTAGQVLAEIDPEQHKAALAQARAQVLAAEAQVAEAEATLTESRQESDRSKDLFAKGLLSPKELESATAKTDRAVAALKSAQASDALAKASFDSARSKLAKTQIISPISGTVLSRKVEVGQTLNAGMQTPVLYNIAEDLRRMRLSSWVDEADIGTVLNGQAASFSVDAYPGRKFASSVTAVRNVPQTNQNVVSYEVLLTVDNQEMLLKPGMTASVEITTEKHTDVMLVPNKAFRFSPPKEDMGFRGPPGGGMPFLRNADSDKSKTKKPSDPVRDLGKIEGNQGILWMADDKGPPGSLRPVKVEKFATDGIRTAIRTKEIKVGDAVIVEQADSGQQKP